MVDLRRLRAHPDNKTKQAMQRDCEQAADELEALRKDAERYRVLRGSLEPGGKSHTEMPVLFVPMTNGAVTYTPEGLDEALDRMREALHNAF